MAIKDLVLVLGLEVSGGSELCKLLAGSGGGTSRECVHLELSELMKAEMARGTELGDEISTTIQQGKMMPKSAAAALVRAALEGAPAGACCLLEGYPASLASLNAMGDDVGYTPSAALLLELPDATAHERFAAKGVDEDAATQKLRAFDMHHRAIIAELDQRSSVLHRLEAAGTAEAMAPAARAVIDGLARARCGRLVLMLGGPGAGTSEQCGRLAAKFGCAHLCIERLMRSAVKEESETGRAIADLVRGGKIVPAQLYLALLRAALEQQPGITCLVDGFPKSLDNLQLLEAHMGACERALLLDTSDATLEARLVAADGGGGSGGGSSTPEAAQRKIRTYRNQTLPAIQSLDARGVLTKVDASADADAVFSSLAAAYEQLRL